MWKYIITWCIINSIPCDFTRIDEFGRRFYDYDLVDCRYKVYDCNHRKEFIDRSEAFSFYKRALLEVASDEYYLGSENNNLYNITIDSLYFKGDSMILLNSIYEPKWIENQEVTE